jgi:hypothetical protein
MAPSTEEFASELAREVRPRRSVGGHPFGHRVAMSRPALQTFDHIVLEHASRESVPAGVRRAVDTSLGMWRQSFGRIARAEEEQERTGG